jgi:hypothetical protein
MEDFIKEKYNLQVVEIKTLEGYESENYYVKTADKKYVLKIYKDEIHLKDLLSAENKLLQLLSVDNPNSYSVPIADLNGNYLTETAIGFARFLTFVEGELLAKKEVGGYLLGLFKELAVKYEVCGDARGEGLFLGLEFVEDKPSKAPNSKLASFVQDKLRDEGILIGTDVPFVNIIKVKPPICFTKENADGLVGKIDRILAEM